MKEETRKVFVAEDGKPFDTEAACKVHEDYLTGRKMRLDKMRFFCVTHSPDLTEGRGWYGLTYVALEVTESYSKDHELWLRDFCFTQFGYAMQFVQGCAPMNGWHYSEITQGEFDQWPMRSTSVGDYSHKAKAIFLSNCGDYPGLPPATTLKACHNKFKEKAA